ncbi:hypothetical protein H1P_340019 [Hyella patelloides LEGE 07179]|uniref:Uncharacterized protein n=1 Tax=Hyella patelloides LEGE 07179 TaxID=945734 RepID=A0A563VW57_9CYAN|nr:hypothetical protein H1P_340019 [Hyella patelloides LEGE 07179]
MSLLAQDFNNILVAKPAEPYNKNLRLPRLDIIIRQLS